MTEAANYRLGFDIGGTFTDFVLVNEATGRTHLNKCLTTPHDPSQGVMTGLGPLFDEAGIAGGEVKIAIHATTLVTNALIERKGAHTAFLTTQGFADVPEMGTEVRYDIYDLRMKRPQPLVRRAERYEVAERIAADGSIVQALDEDGMRAIAARLRKSGAESVAIVFLHSFRNAAHELRAGEILAEELPDISISLSSQVAPEIREYERMTTTIANAYVQPLTRKYVDIVEDGLKRKSYSRPLFLMLSSGGISTARTARDFPIRIVESGPAAGVLAAIYFGRAIGIESMVTFDMGGTTAKIGLVKNGAPAKSRMIEVDRVERFKKGSGTPVKVPIIELIEIGAGGGSIAHVDELGLLKVGPESASAEPGPACYGRGGTEPSVTDANVVLGYLSPDFFLGGSMQLDRGAAQRAIENRLARPLKLNAERAAQGVFEVVNHNMLSAMKVHIAERGEDPRKFYLFAFGGAGPTHAYELARSLGMKGVIVPSGAGTTSAMGLVTTAVSFDFARSLVGLLDRFDWVDICRLFDEMELEGRRVLADAGIPAGDPSIKVTRNLDLRHRGQGYEVTVPLSDEIFASGSVPALCNQFYKVHRDKFGHAHENLAVELITCRMSVSGPSPDVPLVCPGGTDDPVHTARKGSRMVFFPEVNDYLSSPVYDRYRLAPGTTFAGPAIIEERECTVAAGPSARVRVDEFGTLFLELGKE